MATRAGYETDLNKVAEYYAKLYNAIRIPFIENLQPVPLSKCDCIRHLLSVEEMEQVENTHDTDGRKASARLLLEFLRRKPNWFFVVMKALDDSSLNLGECKRTFMEARDEVEKKWRETNCAKGTSTIYRPAARNDASTNLLTFEKMQDVANPSIDRPPDSSLPSSESGEHEVFSSKDSSGNWTSDETGDDTDRDIDRMYVSDTDDSDTDGYVSPSLVSETCDASTHSLIFDGMLEVANPSIDWSWDSSQPFSEIDEHGFLSSQDSYGCWSSDETGDDTDGYVSPSLVSETCDTSTYSWAYKEMPLQLANPSINWSWDSLPETDEHEVLSSQQLWRSLPSQETVPKVPLRSRTLQVRSEDDTHDGYDYAVDPNLHSKTWYHGEMTRAQAEDILRPRGVNSFLVRYNTERRHFCVSAVSHKRIVNFRINDDKVGAARYYVQGRAEQFVTITELVNYYRSHPLATPDGIIIYLTNDSAADYEHLAYMP